MYIFIIFIYFIYIFILIPSPLICKCLKRNPDLREVRPEKMTCGTMDRKNHCAVPNANPTTEAQQETAGTAQERRAEIQNTYSHIQREGWTITNNGKRQSITTASCLFVCVFVFVQTSNPNSFLFHFNWIQLHLIQVFIHYQLCLSVLCFFIHRK